MKKVIYIAGKITGDENYKRKFSRAELQVMSVFENPVILNPAELPEGMTEKQYMTICLAMVNVSDAVFALPDWHESEGAKVEVAYAEKVGIEVYYD